MKKSKLSLKSLKVQSFVTDMNDENVNTVKGGMGTIGSIILCAQSRNGNCNRTDAIDCNGRTRTC